MNKPLVSIAMATYNGERFLQEQLDSIVAQTYRPLEIVISDDGSVDGTKDILDRFANETVRCNRKNQEDIAVRLLDHHSTGQPTDNFRFAMKHCGGEWLAFSDQDDRWHPDKVGCMVDAGRKLNASVVVCAYESFEDGRKQRIVHYSPKLKIVRRLGFPNFLVAYN